MKKAYFLLGVIGLMVIIALVLQLNGISSKNKQAQIVGSDRDIHGCIGSAGYSWCELKQKCLRAWEEKCETESSPVVLADSELPISANSEIIVLSPKQNELVTSPLKIEGQAKGNWFFEASMPVKLFSGDNQLITAASTQALDDWMTEKPVRFSSNLEFSTNATSGYLVIAKDNPSGLPQNDGLIKIPVRFK